LDVVQECTSATTPPEIERETERQKGIETERQRDGETARVRSKAEGVTPCSVSAPTRRGSGDLVPEVRIWP